jgi:hypothetical protein
MEDVEGSEEEDGVKREARVDMSVDGLNEPDEVDDEAETAELAQLGVMRTRWLQHCFPSLLILPSYLDFRIVFIDQWVGTDR